MPVKFYFSIHIIYYLLPIFSTISISMCFCLNVNTSERWFCKQCLLSNHGSILVTYFLISIIFFPIDGARPNFNKNLKFAHFEFQVIDPNLAFSLKAICDKRWIMIRIDLNCVNYKQGSELALTSSYCWLYHWYKFVFQVAIKC